MKNVQVNVWAESIEDGMFKIPKQKVKKKSGRYNSLSCPKVFEVCFEGLTFTSGWIPLALKFDISAGGREVAGKNP